MINDFGFVEGGASQVAIGSAGLLADRGHEVTLFVGVGATSPLGTNVKFISAGIRSTRDDPIRVRAAANGLWNPAALATLKRVVALADPDTIFHLHSWTKALSNSLLSGLEPVADRVVVTLHDYFTACPNGGFYDYRAQQICPLKPMSRACICTDCDSRSYGEKLWRVARHLTQTRGSGFPGWCRHFIYLSDLSLERLRPALPSSAQFHRVLNPVFKPEVGVDPGLNRDAVMLGRLAPEKGGMLFAEAAGLAGVPPRYIGDGVEADSIRKTNPSAQITGWLSGSGVDAQLRSARMLVFPSRWLETFGLGVLEAAALGIPSVVSDACAAREFVGRSERGLLFRSGDAGDLSRKLTALLHDDQLVRKLGAAAKDFVFKWAPGPAEHAAALEKVYRSMLGM